MVNMSDEAWAPAPLQPGWVNNRKLLQEKYESLSSLIDASRFAYLRGQEVYWSEEDVVELWRSALNNPVSPTDPHNNLYVHVPFCKSICTFCNYERLQPSSTDLLRDYMNRMVRSVETLAPVLDSMTWHAWYIGGGTPSILPPKMLDRLLTTISNAFKFHPRAGKHFEFDPAVMSNEKTEILRKHGFEHFSFGIQTLDPEANELHNRGPQDMDMVGKRFKSFYDNGLYDVSCDILLGLAGTTADSILKDIRHILTEYQPRRIDVFSLTPTHSYVDKYFEGSFEAFWEHLKPFQELVVPSLSKVAKETGYDYFDGNGHHMMLERSSKIIKPKMHTKSLFAYNALAVETKRPIHLLGLGRSARSQIFGYAAFQARDPEGEGVDKNGPAEYVGHRIDREVEIRTYLAHYLRDTNVIDRAIFRRIFGVDMTEAIPLALSTWQSQGILDGVSKKEVRLKKQSRPDRTRSLISIVPDEFLEYEVARRDRLDLRSESLLGMLHPLNVGSKVAGRFVMKEPTRSRIHLVDEKTEKKVTLRVAPQLDQKKQGTIRLIVETRPPADEEGLGAFKKMVGQLRKLLAIRHAEILSRSRDGGSRRNENRAPAYSTEITKAS
jgi:coproporphyrinogen III oxidase-like Fe-S oxidoreductase